MNKKQLQYVIELSKNLNMSKAAEHLGISQPALSKQILNLEKELDVKLFNRDVIPMELTAAGEYFVQEAKAIIYKEEKLIRSMERFRDGDGGRLTIGVSPFRSLYMLPFVMKKVKQKYPNIEISLREAGSDILRTEIQEGKYDFAIVNLPVDESVLDVTPLEKDKLVLAVPNKLCNLLEGKTKQGTELDFGQCRNLPFVTVGQSQELRHFFDALCARYEFTPQIVMDVVGVSTVWAMVRAGIGAAVLPLQFIGDDLFDNDVSLYSIKDVVFSRQPVIVTRRGQYLSDVAKYTISLLENQSSKADG